ncbi:Ornithine/DAP/Arg decarboxylase [Carpediemonas membranifera]|uniref:ornithine decarboxylase n=1 Tax=Carpediemonas membranifera TaxID=201153 RepID=A0A8J6E2C3_9EUKA|nr:Ornithine/DAP/Arg decarboxylase [Carpediemonas membranifera]|eukprot:KAG9391732.1 Ornithine/DAP/Arg decarboxylase [Carpediemonas membranifera]
MTKRIQQFLNEQKPATPCVVIDLDVIKNNYGSMRTHLPLAQVFYAVKANPAPEVVNLLVNEGSSFDVASVPEVDLCLSQGANPDNISFGNTIKKEPHIAYAYSKGIRLFAFDSEEELLKISRAAPGSKVYCRILVENEGAQWPLSRKFGCEVEMAEDLLCQARELGLVPYGVSFHVGSQQTDLSQWDVAMTRVASLFMTLQERGIELTAINLGGGFPAHYIEHVEEMPAYADAVMRAIVGHFGNRLPKLMIEPGRSMVGDSGVLQAEVVLVSRKSNDDCKRWVYLDAGKFNGLAETLDEAITYRVTTSRDGEETEPVILAGPTCDSVDVIYEKKEYSLPLGLKAGDLVQFHSTGAYTTSYASVNFNGFEPIKAYCI